MIASFQILTNSSVTISLYGKWTKLLTVPWNKKTHKKWHPYTIRKFNGETSTVDILYVTYCSEEVQNRWEIPLRWKQTLLVCHLSWLLSSISFPPFFVIVQPLLRCVTQKVAQSAKHNATRQNMLQHLYVFSAKREKPNPHHDRLYCDLKNVRPGTNRMTVKFQHHWNTTSKSTEDSDDFHLQLGFRQTSPGLIHRRKLKALKKYPDKEIYVNVKEGNMKYSGTTTEYEWWWWIIIWMMPSRCVRTTNLL